MKEAIGKAKKVVIIGGDFIGGEIADELLKIGKDITFIGMEGSPLPAAIDREFGDMAAEILQGKGVRILLNSRVKEIKCNESVEAVLLENGDSSRFFPGALGTFSTRIGNTAFGVSGLTEAKAKSIGIDYVVGISETANRPPGKLPGATKIYIKLIYARYSHVLLGAQVKGGESVGELINMYSVVIQNRMTDMEIDALQIGTHPLLTSSPIAYSVVNATVDAILKWYK